MAAPDHNPLGWLCDEAAATIEGLDGTPYATASIAAPSWRHSRQALTAAGSAISQHLLFSVSVERAAATGTGAADYTEVEADLRVVFLFKLGAGEYVERERLAMAAARDVASALLRDWPYGRAHVRLADLFTPGELVGDFLPVELRFAARVDIPHGSP